MNIIRLLLIGGLLYIAIQQKKESTRNMLLVVTGLLAVCMLSKEGFIIDTSDGAADSTSCTADVSTSGTCGGRPAPTSQTTESECISRSGTWTEPCTGAADETACTGLGSPNQPDSTGTTVTVCSWEGSSCIANPARAADYTSTCTGDAPPPALATQSECQGDDGTWINPCDGLDSTTCTSTDGCSSSSTKTLASLFGGAGGAVVDGTTITIGSNTYNYTSSTDPITSIEQLANRFTCSGEQATAIPETDRPAGTNNNIINSPPAEPVNLENYISCPSSEGTTPSPPSAQAPSRTPSRTPSSTPSPSPSDSSSLPSWDFSDHLDGYGNYVVYGILSLFIIAACFGALFAAKKRRQGRPALNVSALQQALADGST